MGWVVGIILGLLLIAAMGEPAVPVATPVPTTVTVAPNPGGGHCGFGHNDDDVRAVIRATPSTEPHC